MEPSNQRIFYYLGIIAALYFLFSYILPFLFKLLGFAFKAIFMILMWAAIGLVVFLLVVHIIDRIKK